MADERTQRHLAAILAADVVGYSRLIEHDERETFERFRAHRQELFEPEVGRHSGRIFKLTGDGFLAEFASVVDAVECAVALQREMAARNESASDGRRMDFRLAVNLGDVIVEGEDRLGEGVIIAARLEALADPGGILISGPAFDQVRNKTGHHFEDLGAQALKSIAEPVRVYRLAGTLQPAATAPALASAVALNKPSIAVLPFTNMSGDPEQQYFSDGITEDIITDLSRWHQLTVQSRSASFRYRGAAADLGRMARELNVRYIVEGSVQRRAERIRISAQLIDTETGSYVWADRFDRQVAELFKVQDEVVQTIVGTLVGRVRVADVERARRMPPASLAAYECVLQGNAMLWSDAKGAAEATRLFEQAIELDPGYGYAHALLAVMRYRQWSDNLGGSDALLDEPWRLANRAVELDGNESTCFSILSQVCLLRRSFDLALQHMRRAIEINATNQWNTANMAIVLSYVGRAEDAIACFKRAREIDQYFDPPWYWQAFGLTHMNLRRYEQALEKFERSSARPYRLAAYMAGCHSRLGAMSSARALAAECLEKKPDFTIVRAIAKEPFKDPADTAHLVECLRAAGLPE